MGTWAPWLVVFATLVPVAPEMLLRALGRADHRAADPALLVAGGLLLAALIAIGRPRPNLLRRTRERVSRRAVLVLIAAALGAALAISDSPLRSWPYCSVLAAMCAALAVLVHALRQPPVSDRQFALRAATAASVLVAGESISRQLSGGFSWACHSPIVSAEAAAYASADALPLSLLTAVLVATLLAGTLVRRARSRLRAHAASLLPLLSVGLLLVGQALVAVLAGIAATIVREGAHGPPPPHEPIELLATLADTVGGVCAALGAGLFVVAVARVVAAPRVRRRELLTLRATWPLVPLALVLGSPVFEPPVVVRFPQQAPEAVWREPTVEPLVRVRRDADDEGPRHYIPFFPTQSARVTGMLRPRGELVLFQGGREESFHGLDDRVDAPGTRSRSARVELIVDRRATLRDLRWASRALAGFESMSLVWLSTELGQASRAVERWAFVDMASRALRADELALAPPDSDCSAPSIDDGLEVRRCGEVVVLVGEEELAIGELLDWLDRHPRQRVGLLARRPTEREYWRAIDGPGRPPDPAAVRWMPRDAPAALLGALVAVVLAFVQTWRGLRARRDTSGAPYRVDARRVGRPAPSHGLLAHVARTTSALLLEGCMRWTFVAVTATLIGLALR